MTQVVDFDAIRSYFVTRGQQKIKLAIFEVKLYIADCRHFVAFNLAVDCTVVDATFCQSDDVLRLKIKKVKKFKMENFIKLK
jgi:hypothetical protein